MGNFSIQLKGEQKNQPFRMLIVRVRGIVYFSSNQNQSPSSFPEVKLQTSKTTKRAESKHQSVCCGGALIWLTTVLFAAPGTLYSSLMWLSSSSWEADWLVWLHRVLLLCLGGRAGGWPSIVVSGDLDTRTHTDMHMYASTHTHIYTHTHIQPTDKQTGHTSAHKPSAEALCEHGSQRGNQALNGWTPFTRPNLPSGRASPTVQAHTAVSPLIRGEFGTKTHNSV